MSHAIHWLLTYGYAGVFLVVALESLALPIPGETVLVAAAIYAGKTHHLQIGLLVAVAAIAVVVGGGAGFLLGRARGYAFVRRYQRYLHLNEPRLRLGQYLFLRYGGRLVFFGRFVALLRAFVAFLAGVNQMPMMRFFVWHAVGALAWATFFGFGGYLLGDEIERFSRTAGLLVLTGAVVGIAFGLSYLQRHFRKLQLRADQTIRELPA